MDGEGRTATDELEELVAAAERLTEQELLETVVEEFAFTLCASCRAMVRMDPAGANTSRVPVRRTQQ
jgi:hypothetical protein